MASPSPRRKVEVRFCWLLLSAVCCLLSAAGCCYRPWCLAVPPRHVPRTPPCFGRDTSPWTAQHQKFSPSAAALQRMAGRFTRCWRGLANGTVPGVGKFIIIITLTCSLAPRCRGLLTGRGNWVGYNEEKTSPCALLCRLYSGTRGCVTPPRAAPRASHADTHLGNSTAPTRRWHTRVRGAPMPHQDDDAGDALRW